VPGIRRVHELRRVNSLTAPHHRAKRTESAPHAVMYIGPTSAVRGDKRLDANGGEQLASSLLSPLAVRTWPTCITAQPEQFELLLAQ
jgi:hypothetical protein